MALAQRQAACVAQVASRKTKYPQFRRMGVHWIAVQSTQPTQIEMGVASPAYGVAPNPRVDGRHTSYMRPCCSAS
jgi:hypothetical protein